MKTIVAISCLLFSAITYAKTDWKLVHEEDEIKIFSADFKKSGVIPFKAIGTINSPLEKVVEVLLDHQNKPVWSPKLDAVKIHKKLKDNEFLFSEYYRTPWPSTDREFLLKGRVDYVTKNKVVFSASSVDNNFRNEDYIQTEVYYLNVTLNRVGDSATLMEFSFHGDMKGWMPVWLMNIIQKKWPLRFIQGLKKQVSKTDVRSLTAISYKK